MTNHDRAPNTNQYEVDYIFSADIADTIHRSYYEVPAITNELKVAMSQLDTLHETLPPADVVSVVGAMTGIKPSTSLSAYTPDQANLYKDVANQLGLKYNYDEKNGLISLSRYQLLADETASLFSENITSTRQGFDLPDETEYKIGSLLGYPRVATDMFIERIKVHAETGDWPPQINASEYGQDIDAFTEFILPENEFDKQAVIDGYVRPLHDASKELTPQTYRRILAEGESS